MIRKFFIVITAYLFVQTAMACDRAVPTNDANFCSSFKSVAACYCTSSGLPSGMCQDVRKLYARLLIIYGSLQTACDRQKYTTSQDCMDNWNCYLFGKVNSPGRICSKACQ
ncbi:TPA: hypothetical protein ACPSKE_002079 [Legionella feeleii]|uniref:ShKT domain-containing protein n=1 Tax=Legionella feeleii TaxID=453 RepID=A0A0W0TGW5_9GAMM|nr:hypothetical protein [Legionella feeleii]KTC94811.1 hypothetical protein Lfee_2475 [Legionella feeleii]SPX60394.1 Uncharacterised protein [Legionella feeleii]STX37237.1 Uncharacterised protein [Legionella feeleii]